MSRLRRGPLYSYTAYSIGCFIVWAVILIARTGSKRHDVFLVFCGWAIGWLSATIGRAVYPPPKRAPGLPNAPTRP